MSQLISASEGDLCFDMVERDDVIAEILKTDVFVSLLHDQPAQPPVGFVTADASETRLRLPAGVSEGSASRLRFPALMTTPGAGKSRVLHEFCAHHLVALQRPREVFVCASPCYVQLQYGAL